MDFNFINDYRSNLAVTLYVKGSDNMQNREAQRIDIKNLLAEIKSELNEHYSMIEKDQLLANLDSIEADFTANLKTASTIYFISNDVYEQLDLPFTIESGYQVGSRFKTRKLLRSLNKANHYYTLVIDTEEAKLFEYQNQQFIKEICDEKFPVKNSGYWTADRLLNSMGSVRSNYQKEFFKVIDAALQTLIHREPHPVVIVGLKENIATFKAISSNVEILLGEVNGSFYTTEANDRLMLGELTYKEIQKHSTKKIQNMIEILDKHQSKGRLEQDLANIYMNSIKGKGKTLFVNEDFYQEGILLDGQLSLKNIDDSKEDYIEDIVNEIISQVMRYGGEVIFTNEKILQKYNPIALILRY